MDWKFEVGQRVRKTGGYPFPGIVEARFLATQIDGSKVDRYIVNQTVVMHSGIGPSGLLHIFAPAQLKAVDEAEYVGPHDADAEAVRGAYTQEMTEQFTREQFSIDEVEEMPPGTLVRIRKTGATGIVTKPPPPHRGRDAPTPDEPDHRYVEDGLGTRPIRLRMADLEVVR